MLVTCTFYGLRHRRAKVAFQVERERLAVGESFSWAGETYVILSVVAGDDTYAANVAPEQSARARMLPRPRPPGPGLSGGQANGRRPPPEASTGQARLEACEAQLQRLQRMHADARTQLGQLVQQLDHLQLGEARGDLSEMSATSMAASGAGEAAQFPELLQALEAQLRLRATRLAQLQSENRRLAADDQAARARIAALEAELHDLRLPRAAAPAATEGSWPPRLPAREPSEAYMIARLRDRLTREPADVQTRVELATLYARHGLDAHAIREYRQVLTLRPACVAALEPLALLLEKLNRPRDAAVLWERLLGGRREPDPAPSGGPEQTARGSPDLQAVGPQTRRRRTPWPVTLVARLLTVSPRAAR